MPLPKPIKGFSETSSLYHGSRDPIEPRPLVPVTYRFPLCPLSSSHSGLLEFLPCSWLELCPAGALPARSPTTGTLTDSFPCLGSFQQVLPDQDAGASSSLPCSQMFTASTPYGVFVGFLSPACPRRRHLALYTVYLFG